MADEANGQTAVSGWSTDGAVVVEVMVVVDGAVVDGVVVVVVVVGLWAVSSPQLTASSDTPTSPATTR